MYKRIMIVVDDTKVTDAAISEGIRLAASAGASVVFIHVVSPYVLPLSDLELAAYQSLDAFRAKQAKFSQRLLARATSVAKGAGVPSVTVSASGEDAASCISDRATSQRCDLIVIGSHGRTTMQRLLQGSVVTNLITVARLPILVCKKGARVATKANRLVAVPTRKKAPLRRRVAA